MYRALFLLLIAADGDCSSTDTATLETTEVSGQVGPGPGRGMPVYATYEIGLCVDAEDGLVAFDLAPGTRIATFAELCDGDNEGCGDISHVCCRPADYLIGMQEWPAELTEDINGLLNTQRLTVACEDDDDYVRLTYLLAQGDPGQFG